MDGARTHPRLMSGKNIGSDTSLGALIPYGFSAFTRNLYSEPSSKSSRSAVSCLLVDAFNHMSQPTLLYSIM